MPFADKFLDQILDKTKLQRFFRRVNYIKYFIPGLAILLKPLHDRLNKPRPPWKNIHTKVVKEIKLKAKDLPCLSLLDPMLSK